jgi:hypothetical protein
MRKTFGELKVGDDIYYYDHCKLHKQKVTSIEIVKGKEVAYKDFFGREWKRTEDDELVIKAGKGTIIKIYSRYSKNEYINFLMPKFSNYEAGLDFINNLKNKHKKRMEKYYNRYLKEKRIIEKYSNDVDKSITMDKPISAEILIKNGFKKDYNPYTKEDIYQMENFPFTIVYNPYYKEWYAGVEVVTRDEDYNIKQFTIQTINDLYNLYKMSKINKEIII